MHALAEQCIGVIQAGYFILQARFRHGSLHLSILCNRNAACTFSSRHCAARRFYALPALAVQAVENPAENVMMAVIKKASPALPNSRKAGEAVNRSIRCLD